MGVQLAGDPVDCDLRAVFEEDLHLRSNRQSLAEALDASPHRGADCLDAVYA